MPNPPNSLDIVKLQLLDEGAALMTEAQVAEQALAEQVAQRRRLLRRGYAAPAFSGARPQYNPAEAQRQLNGDFADVTRGIALGAPMEPQMFGGMDPREITNTVGLAGQYASHYAAMKRSRANDMGKQQEFADMNDRAAARMGRAPSSTLLPDALLLDVPIGQGESALPEADPDLRFLPRAQPPAVMVSPYGGLMLEEDDALPLSDRLFPQVY